MKRKILLLLGCCWGGLLPYAHASTTPQDSIPVQSVENRYDSIVTVQAKHLNDLQTEFRAVWQRLRKEEGKGRVQDSMMTVFQQRVEGMQDSFAHSRQAICRGIEEANASIRVSTVSLKDEILWRGIVGVGLIVLLAMVVVLLYRRMRGNALTVDGLKRMQEKLRDAQTKMQEESLKMDNKLLELAEKQMENFSSAGSHEVDHSLALKVADEMTRIEVNLSRMDPTVRGYKQLAKAVERIKDNFLANGYEIVAMLGKPYNEGMKVSVNFVNDESLEAGKQIITGIIKPQVNYNGKMIQTAQITVNQNV